jgi:hypothetical protein
MNLMLSPSIISYRQSKESISCISFIRDRLFVPNIRTCLISIVRPIRRLFVSPVFIKALISIKLIRLRRFRLLRRRWITKPLGMTRNAKLSYTNYTKSSTFYINQEMTFKRCKNKYPSNTQ